MRIVWRLLHPLLLCSLAMSALAMPARAQSTATGVPNALQGFSQNRGKPIKIDATTLEVRDKDKTATFVGSVNLVQGDTTLKCKTLVVHYDQNTSGAKMISSTPGPGGSQQIRRLEAKGDVVVTQKDQVATGENGVFDMKSNTITLTGKVVVSTGPNVLRGDRLVVDMTTGVSRVESLKSGRVEGLFLPGSAKEGRSGPTAAKGDGPAKDTPAKDTARPAPPAPLRLN